MLVFIPRRFHYIKGIFLAGFYLKISFQSENIFPNFKKSHLFKVSELLKKFVFMFPRTSTLVDNLFYDIFPRDSSWSTPNSTQLIIFELLSCLSQARYLPLLDSAKECGIVCLGGQNFRLVHLPLGSIHLLHHHHQWPHIVWSIPYSIRLHWR